jgi:hypothetical protein
MTKPDITVGLVLWFFGLIKDLVTVNRDTDSWKWWQETFITLLEPHCIIFHGVRGALIWPPRLMRNLFLLWHRTLKCFWCPINSLHDINYVSRQYIWIAIARALIRQLSRVHPFVTSSRTCTGCSFVTQWKRRLYIVSVKFKYFDGNLLYVWQKIWRSSFVVRSCFVTSGAH